MARQTDKASAMHMNDDVLQLMEMFYLYSFLNQWQLLVIKHSYQNMVFVFFEDI
jgi:hypothetical protein